MIGTHDSYTFLPSKIKLFERISFLWRTQSKSIYEQEQLGVSYFDIRIRRSKNVWRVCHGLVDFNLTFNSIEEIIRLFSKYKIRLILERGSSKLFRQEIRKNINCEVISFAAIKYGWEILINRDSTIHDYTYTPWLSNLSFWENIKRCNFFSTIKKWAKKYNPTITPDIITENNLYFMDYV